jgi:transcriptional regulator with XRE-family HTH domain
MALEVLPFKTALRLIRLKRKCSQKQLAKKLGVQRPTITRYESGTNDVSTEQVHALADALQVAPELFFRLTPDSDELKVLVPLSVAPENPWGDHMEGRKN